MIIFVSTLLGAIYRMAEGGWGHLSRSLILALGAALAAAIIYWQSSDLVVASTAAFLTLAYFTVGNTSVLKGDDPAWPFARALLTKFVAPTLAINLVLAGLGYTTVVFLSGMIASLGYWLTWRYQPFQPWNRYAEAIMGGSYFGLIAWGLSWTIF